MISSLPYEQVYICAAPPPCTQDGLLTRDGEEANSLWGEKQLLAEMLPVVSVIAVFTQPCTLRIQLTLAVSVCVPSVLYGWPHP